MFYCLRFPFLVVLLFLFVYLLLLGVFFGGGDGWFFFFLFVCLFMCPYMSDRISVFKQKSGMGKGHAARPS